MTCIVGFTDKAKGVTYIGVDSQGSAGYHYRIRKDKKVFKLKDTDNALAGFTTSFRMGQLLMYATGLIDKRDEPDIDHEYITTKFVPKLIRVFEDGGFARSDSGEKSGGTFLLAYKDKLWRIENDYQVAEYEKGYDACGCGEQYALGSLKTSEGLDMDPVARIHLALETAASFSCGVGAPFYIMNTKDDEVIEFTS